jgi:hypothetical protein
LPTKNSVASESDSEEDTINLDFLNNEETSAIEKKEPERDWSLQTHFK